MKLSPVVRSGAVAALGGFLVTFGLVTAVWDNDSATVLVAVVGAVAIVAANILSSPGQPRYVLIGSAVLGGLLYPVSVIVWLTQFYTWP